MPATRRRTRVSAAVRSPRAFVQSARRGAMRAPEYQRPAFASSGASECATTHSATARFDAPRSGSSRAVNRLTHRSTGWSSQRFVGGASPYRRADVTEEERGNLRPDAPDLRHRHSRCGRHVPADVDALADDLDAATARHPPLDLDRSLSGLWWWAGLAGALEPGPFRRREGGRNPVTRRACRTVGVTNSTAGVPV